METNAALFAAGAWVPLQEPRHRLAVVNPATEVPLSALPAGTAQDVDLAVQAARAAFPAWAAWPAQARAEHLGRLAAALAERAEALTDTITAEVGMPRKLTRRVQVDGPLAAWAFYAGQAQSFAFETQVAHSRVLREPKGVVACITPWNYPLHQITCKVAPALAAGCTVVLKPAETAPGSALILVEAVQAAGLPPGVFNLVLGEGPVVGEALAGHAGVDMVSFTGSTRAGRRVAELAARQLKPVALELGGKSAAIVLDDADFAAAAKGVVGACFLNSGQTCSAHTRMLVPEAAYGDIKALVAKAVASYTVGDPMDPGTRLGPVANARQYQQVRDCIAAGLAEAARGTIDLIAGGADRPATAPQKGYYIAPTVFGRVDPASPLAREEIFGPVLSILCYRDEAEAIRLANDSDYGLGGGIWSGNVARALRVARQLQTGQVDINGAPFNAMAPFGGYKQSGLGRENGVYGMEEFLHYKAVQLPLEKPLAPKATP